MSVAISRDSIHREYAAHLLNTVTFFQCSLYGQSSIWGKNEFWVNPGGTLRVELSEPPLLLDHFSCYCCFVLLEEGLEFWDGGG